MSKIQEQIKALQLKQKKIEYISYINDLISNDTKCIDFKEIQKEIVSKIEPFLLDLMTSIETDTPIKKEETSIFTEQEISILKSVANTIANKPKPSENKPFVELKDPQLKPSQPAPTQELSINDKMAFALGNRHLANKRVKVMNDKNVDISGVVVAIDAPNVMVKTDTGPVIAVPVQNLSLIS